jgi:glutamine---fructose-6-phosphate transaminase (isomerizing)
MCGIFGIIAPKDSNADKGLICKNFEGLFKLSESRGKEAAGMVAVLDKSVEVLKMPIPATEFMKTREYNDLTSIIKAIRDDQPVALIGHSRLVTNGTEDQHFNNQPVCKEGVVTVHNGIIVNDYEIWNDNPELVREYEVDTEVVPTLIASFRKTDQDIIHAIKKTFSIIKGATSVALVFDDINKIGLATNNGSLYVAVNNNKKLILFGSEKYILDQLFEMTSLENTASDFQITQVTPGFARIIDIDKFEIVEFSLDPSVNGYSLNGSSKLDSKRAINDRLNYSQVYGNAGITHIHTDNFNAKENLLFVDLDKINALKRCTKCLLPETFPFIHYDENGVCNICKNYHPIEIKSMDILHSEIEKYRKRDSFAECILPFSGGRDSSYALHYVKKELGLKPVAYTYDWGMVTDIARRNISRLCGELGVEHILVSADIRKKRNNIRKNVLAWLKQPELGMIPLFMAGDKQYFTTLNRLMDQLSIRLAVYGENQLEKTNFKTGFCGIDEGGSRVYDISSAKKARMALYYAGNFIKNPAYLNSSLLDSFSAFKASYVANHDYLFLYHYLRWNENTINDTLINQYGWEVSKDIKSTWRIGDGTASFYNYIYFKVAGFTEFDTFRSNQIREGMITREEAIKNINEENKPRFESMKWYCDTIGIDFNRTIEIINKIPTLYDKVLALKR